MRKSLWVVLAILVAIACPNASYAREIDYLQSFNNGLETLKGNDVSEKVEPEREYIEGYEPELLEVETREVGEEPSVLQAIQGWVMSLKIQAFGGTYAPNRWHILVQQFLTSNSLFPVFFGVAVALVFVWWGVRKSKSIIWTAYRTGRLNLGTSVKRELYRRKAKEWYG